MAITAEQITETVETIVHGAQERYVTDLTDYLIDSLVHGVFNGTTRTTLEALARANRSEIQTLLMQHRSEINDDVMSLVQDILSQADAGDVAMLEAAYGAIPTTTKYAELSYQAARGLSEIIARQNIALAYQAEKLWYEVAGEAITSITQGLASRDSLIAKSVVQLADAGITVIDYVSGISNQVDVATRRHLVSQLSQIGGDMTLSRLKDVGHELVVTSAHFGARPTHAAWQGIPCCVSGQKRVNGKKYPGLRDFTGYGTVEGLKGVNCRHQLGPYFPGISTLPDREFNQAQKKYGMTSDEFYEATQRQRELERRIRGTKREIAGMERAGLGLESPSYVQKKLVLDKQQRTLKAHVEQNKLVRQPKREKAYGIGAQPRALRVPVSKKKTVASSFSSETSRAKNAAMSAFAKAKTAEPKTTALFQKITQDTSSSLAGLEFKQKNVDSILRKMKADAALKGESWKNAADDITDALRYTFVVDTERFSSTFSEIRSTLQENGYKITRIKNTLAETGIAYRGVNVVVEGTDGYLFETQFHTLDSLKVKELNHKLYEEYRLSGTSETRRKELKQLMIANADTIQTPYGIGGVK